jgi:hypothetical protein
VRKPAGLNLGDLDDFAPKQKNASKGKGDIDDAKKIATSVAVKEGFTSRQSKAKVDGRTLRKTDKKSQLNIAVKVTTKDRFWLTAKKLGFTGGEEFLSHLLDNLDNGE